MSLLQILPSLFLGGRKYSSVLPSALSSPCRRAARDAVGAGLFIFFFFCAKKTRKLGEVRVRVLLIRVSRSWTAMWRWQSSPFTS